MQALSIVYLNILIDRSRSYAFRLKNELYKAFISKCDCPKNKTFFLPEKNNSHL